MLKPSLFQLLLCTQLFALVSLMPRTSLAAVTLRFGIPDATSILPIAAPATTTYGTIRGTVTAGSKPVRGVNVHLFSPSYQVPIDTVKTDANGEYVFADVAPGKYKITTQIAGYQDQASSVDISQELTNVDDFNLAVPPAHEEVIIKTDTVSPRLGCVAGYVSDVKSVAGQTTVLCLINRHQHIYSVAEPDAQGRFAFSLVPPGKYRLEFQHPGYPARKTSVSVSAGRTSDFMYLPSIGWSVSFNLFGLFDPSGGYVHLRGSDENDTWAVQLNHPNYETTAPAYGTAFLIR